MLEEKLDSLIVVLEDQNKLIEKAIKVMKGNCCDAQAKEMLNPVSESGESPVKKAVEEAFDESEELMEITLDLLKKLAKEKIKKGVSRSDIKKLITEHGADSLAELDESQFDVFHEALEAL